MCRKEAIHISNYQADTLYAMASPFLIKQLNESWNWRKYLFLEMGKAPASASK
jgi:hypothetical protein